MPSFLKRWKRFLYGLIRISLFISEGSVGESNARSRGRHDSKTRVSVQLALGLGLGLNG